MKELKEDLEEKSKLSSDLQTEVEKLEAERLVNFMKHCVVLIWRSTVFNFGYFYNSIDLSVCDVEHRGALLKLSIGLFVKLGSSAIWT